MKISKRTLIMAASLMLALTMTALGTVAYMTAKDTVTNTFTVGNINIIVDETDVDGSQSGITTPADPENNLPARDQENEYKLIPGMTYVKDPRMTVKAPSEECYVRMRVEMNCYDVLVAETGLTGEDLLKKLVGEIGAGWTLYGTPVADATGKIIYEYRYTDVATGNNKVNAATSDVQLPELFLNITIPLSFDQDVLNKMNGFKLEVHGEAVQTAAFPGGVEDAWTAYNAQVLGITTTSDDDTATDEETTPDTGDETTSGEGGDATEGGENGTIQNSVNDAVNDPPANDGEDNETPVVE